MKLRRKTYVVRADGSRSELTDQELVLLETDVKPAGKIVHEVVDENDEPRLRGPSVTREEADDFARLLNQVREPETTPRLDPLQVSFDDLFADRELLDRVAQVVVANTSCDYMGALDWIKDWSSVASSGGGSPTLREIIEKSPVEVTSFDRDLKGLQAAAKLTELEERDAMASEKVDQQGRVLLEDPDERARKLTDPFEFERAYQRRLDGSGASADGRVAYRAEYEQLLDAGIDPLATMERAERIRMADARRAERDRVEAARLTREGDHRRRQAEKRVADAQADLDRH